jgi:VanZ family protein
VISSRKIFLWGGLAYMVFVIYGSLVPFDFRPRSLDSALRSFMQMRYLRLGADARADWVANILLYIPLSFFSLGYAVRRGNRVFNLCLSIAVFIFCAALGVVIEFAQQFFPPRTVSLNDLFAEVGGTLIGITLWWASGERLRQLTESLLVAGKSAAYAGLMLYTIGYFGFSLFPYDFVISAEEIRAKVGGALFHWLPSRSACGGTLRCSAKLMAESAAAAPLGLLIGVVSTKQGVSLIRSSAWIGGWLGLVIEALQVFLVSGISLGISVLMRVIGVAAGAAVGELLKQTRLWPLLYLLRPFVPLVGAAYFILVAAVTWFGKGPLLSLAAGLKRVSEIQYMPFYYHYYTSESVAMTSVFAVAVMFVPVGILYWIWRITIMREFILRGAMQAFLLAAIVGSFIESGKLFLSSARPDPTNVWIGALSATAGFLAASLCTRASLSAGVSPDDCRLTSSTTADSGARPF